MSLGKVLASVVMFSSFSVSAAGFDDQSGVQDSPDMGAYSAEWVYLNNPLEYQGPGNIVECQRVATYQNGPKTGTWRVYFVCLIEE